MSTSNPIRPNATPGEAGIGGPANLLPSGEPPLEDPRSIAAMYAIGADDQAEFLDLDFDDLDDDRDAGGRSFTDDVRSDRSDDERRERR